MRTIFITLLVTLLLAGCAGFARSPAPGAVEVLRAEFASPNVAVDDDCIFSGPVKNEFINYRYFGLCLFNDKELRLYYRDRKPVRAYTWHFTQIKAYALHGAVFTLATDTGNFGLVVKDAPALVAALRAQRVPENAGLPEFSSKDVPPWYPFGWH